MRHLKDNNMTYWQHWWLAISSSAALFIHAWFPNILENYASKNILSKHLERLTDKMLKNDEKAQQLKSKIIKGDFLKNF